MLRIYSQRHIIESILESEIPSNMFHIITSGHVGVIHIPESDSYNNIDEMGINDDLLANIELTGTTIQWEDDFSDKVIQNHALVIEHPNAIFILDISPEDAIKISKNYGVICMSSYDIKDDMLYKSYEYDLEHGSNGISWGDFMAAGAKDIPSNSMVIIDRYLFSLGEKSGKKEAIDAINLGVENIKCILNGILPKNLSIPTYKVLIVFDSSSILCKQDDNFENEALSLITEELTEYGRRSKVRKYPIEFLLLSIDHNFINYNKTHNRKIISNYFLIRGEHKLRAFNGHVSETTQTLRFDTLFSKIHKNVPNGPHSPIISINQSLNCISEIITLGKSRFFKNLINTKITLDDCKNEKFIFN